MESVNAKDRHGHTLPRPTAGGDDILRVDPAVAIRINELQGFGVKLQPGGGTGERDPEFLIKLIEIHQVRTTGQLDLIKPAGAEKIPSVHCFFHLNLPGFHS